MSRYIDADALMLKLEHEVELADDWKTAHEIKNVVKYFSQADVVEVVRCKDCKHYSADGWGYGNCYRKIVEYLRMNDNGYCSYAERGEDDTQN